jgi:biotin synthase-related radical SAM superfamily protein
MTFEQALKAVDLHEVGAMLEGKKPKAVVMYRRAEEISRLVINWRKIEEEKKGIVAPKIAEIHFEFNRVSRSGKGAEGNRAIAMTK